MIPLLNLLSGDGKNHRVNSACKYLINIYIYEKKICKEKKYVRERIHRKNRTNLKKIYNLKMRE